MSLAACGGTADSGTGSAPPAVSATATPDAGMDMSTMPPANSGAASDAAPTAATSAGSGPAATNAAPAKATLREGALALSQTEVAAGPVHFVVNNTGMMAHNFTIKDASGKVLANTNNFTSNSGDQTLDVTLPAGTYTVYCSLPGHAQRGQQN